MRRDKSGIGRTGRNTRRSPYWAFVVALAGRAPLAASSIGATIAVGDGVTLVSSAEETAKDLYRTLVSADLLRDDDAPPPRHSFLATGDTRAFRTLARRFLGPEVATVIGNMGDEA